MPECLFAGEVRRRRLAGQAYASKRQGENHYGKWAQATSKAHKMRIFKTCMGGSRISSHIACEVVRHFRVSGQSPHEQQVLELPASGFITFHAVKHCRFKRSEPICSSSERGCISSGHRESTQPDPELH